MAPRQVQKNGGNNNGSNNIEELEMSKLGTRNDTPSHAGVWVERRCGGVWREVCGGRGEGNQRRSGSSGKGAVVEGQSVALHVGE